MRNRTQAARGSGFVLLWFLLATASYAWAQSEAELIAGAKKEGKVVFWRLHAHRRFARAGSGI